MFAIDALDYEVESAIYHSGVAHDANPPGRGSGRYGFGSGENPFQHQNNRTPQNYDLFMKMVKQMKADGKTESEIAAYFGMITKKTGEGSSKELRDTITIARHAVRAAREAEAWRLYSEEGSPTYHNYTEVGKKMGLNDTTVRLLLDPSKSIYNSQLYGIKDKLVQELADKKCIMIGHGVENELADDIAGVTRTKLDAAIRELEHEGYQRRYIMVKQMGTAHETNVEVLMSPDMSFADVSKDNSLIKPIVDYTPDGGKTWEAPVAPKSLDSNRVEVKFAENGGTLKDGTIELRPGVADLSLGDKNYAQVRIAVDGKYYLKGMAMYGDPKEFPDGVDVIFNSNKPEAKGKFKAMKELDLSEGLTAESFGATIKRGGQSWYIDKDGKKQQSCINKVNEEGDWDKWSKDLSSQFLSKQGLPLIKQQIKLTLADRDYQLEEINKVTNNELKKKLLIDYADALDSDASHLKVMGIRGEKAKVILPCNELKTTEIYAPDYPNGTSVCLIRFPHAGTFEIPRLTVNNKNPVAKQRFGNSLDAVAINHKVAEQLSGADFDGDTVWVLPDNQHQITTKPYLTDLKNFDPKVEYPMYPGMKVMTSREKGLQMGKTTNLLMDITSMGATDSDIAKVTKHSMVVIDAQKHKLNWRQSYIDNDIAGIIEKYRGRNEAGRLKEGATTIFTKAKAEARVDELSKYRKYDPETGEVIQSKTGKEIKVYKKVDEYKKDSKGNVLYLDEMGNETTDSSKGSPIKVGKTLYKDENGKPVELGTKKAQTITTNMALTNDANTLVFDRTNKKELAYAEYANSLKSLANKARKEAVILETTKQDKEAAQKYAKEVASLQAKLNNSAKNAPRERYAQIIANTRYKAALEANPELKYDKDKLKKLRNRCLTYGREMAGASGEKRKFNITDSEWDAIEAHAITASTMNKIINNIDTQLIREHCTPKIQMAISSAQINKIRAMAANKGGYTIDEIAKACGVSASTVKKYM